MGMRAQLLQAARQAFAAFGDVILSGEYIRKTGDGTRDVTTGVTTYPETRYTIKKLAVAGWTQKEVDKDPSLLNTEKMLFLAEELPAGVAVHSADTIEDSDDVVWEIIKQVKDPARILVILSVRQAS